MEEEGPQSSFMFLVTCNEAFGYSHEQILDSSFVLVVGMLRERGDWMNLFDESKGQRFSFGRYVN